MEGRGAEEAEKLNGLLRGHAEGGLSSLAAMNNSERGASDISLVSIMPQDGSCLGFYSPLCRALASMHPPL